MRRLYGLRVRRFLEPAGNQDNVACGAWAFAPYKGTLLGTPNWEPQKYSRNIMEYEDPGRYIPIIYLLFSWGSQFGVPSRVPLPYTLDPRKVRVCVLGVDVEVSRIGVRDLGASRLETLNPKS